MPTGKCQKWPFPGLTLGTKSNKSKHFHLSAKNGKTFNMKAKKVKKINLVLINMF